MRSACHLLIFWGLLPICGCSSAMSFLMPEGSGSHEVDFAEALVYAKRAAAAYGSPEEIERRFPRRRVVTDQVPGSEVSFFVLFDDTRKTQDIGVRGTDNLTNVKVDVEFTPSPDDRLGIYLHSGFARAGSEVLGRLTPHLKKDYATTITGHSLGGALAAIVGLSLQQDGFSVTAVRTFGQPKITNVEGAKQADGLPIIRFVNGNDPVTDVPPLVNLRNSAWVYTHFGPEVILWGRNRYIYLESHQVIQTGVVSFWSDLGQHQTAEHEMAAYLAALEKLQKKTREIPFRDRDQFRP